MLAILAALPMAVMLADVQAIALLAVVSWRFSPSARHFTNVAKLDWLLRLLSLGPAAARALLGRRSCRLGLRP